MVGESISVLRIGSSVPATEEPVGFLFLRPKNKLMSDSYSVIERWSQRLPWVPTVLAVTAVLLGVAPRYQSPVATHTPVPASATDATPVRRPNPSAVHTVGRFTYTCSECHRTLPEPHAAGGDFTKHEGLQLVHGINTRCLNCHHPVNREVFVDDFGEEIPWDQPQRLCSKCHGPVYRDWQHGSHGRINGYWDTAQGPLVRLRCIQCHDPHHPPFQPLSSAPAPGILRGESPHTSEHVGVRNPLRLHHQSGAHDQAANSEDPH